MCVHSFWSDTILSLYLYLSRCSLFPFSCFSSLLFLRSFVSFFISAASKIVFSIVRVNVATVQMPVETMNKSYQQNEDMCVKV